MPRNTRRFKRRNYDHQRAPMPHSSDMTHMLNVGRISAFRYDIKEIMRRYEIEEGAASTVMASIIAKSSRISIDSAIDYVRDQEKSGAYPREALEEICGLLDRFSKLR